MTIGIVGLGSIGQRHVKNIRALRGSQDRILAYRFRTTPVLDLQTGLPFCDAYTVTEQFLPTRPGCGPSDALFICNPTSEHASWLRWGLSRGCHVFVEKPILDAYDTPQMRRADQVVQVGYQWRFHPTLYRILTDLCEGVIGEVLSVHVVNHEHLPDAHPWEDYRTGYAARKDLGGGVLNCYSHEFDYVRFLFGHPTAAWGCVGGDGTALDLDGSVEETAIVVWLYKRVGWRQLVTFDLSFVGPKPERWCRIVGTDGSLTWDLIRQELTYNTPKRAGPFDTTVHHFVERNELYLAELREFFACIDSGQQPRTSLEDGLAVAQLIGQAKAAMGREGGHHGHTCGDRSCGHFEPGVGLEGSCAAVS